MKRHAHLCLIPLLAACAAPAPKDEPATLADLRRQAAPAAPTGTAADRGKAIEGYREFLKKAEDPMLKAEAMRRLADLSLEEKEERLAAVPEAQRKNLSESEQVIALYEQRLKAYPYHPQNDQVLYQLSRAYENDGQPDKALAALDRMVASYPYSPLLAEAQFRRGEMLFVKKRYEEADKAYRAVLSRGPASGFYDQSLYKRGWSLFKQSLYLEGIDLFLALIDRKAVDGRLDLASLSRPDREQIEDTLRAISLSFAYLDGPETVAEYFASRGNRKDEDVLYEALGSEYLKKERFSDAAATFQAFVAAYPNSDLAPGFQLRAIKAYRKGGFPSQVLDAQKAYVRLFDLRSPYWAARKPEQHPQVVEQLQSSLRDLARHFHAQAQKSKQDADFRSAQDWYQRYLTNFPTSAGAQEMRFLLAELLFEHKNYPEAVAQYEHVAYRYNHNGRGAEAGYGALVAYDKHADSLKGEAAVAWQRQAVASADRFLKSYPAHPQATKALAHAGQRLFDLGEADAASTAVRPLVSASGADPKTRLTAWTIIGHAAFDRGDFLAAEDAYRGALSLSSTPAATRKALEERLSASLYQQGDQRRQRGDLDGAARYFLKAAQATSTEALKATAEFDAAAALLELKRWPQAAEVLEGFRKDHPKHPKQQEVTRRLAVAYMEGGRPAAAAAEFERLAAAEGDSEVQREALLKAAEMQAKADDPVATARLLKAYVERFPSPLDPAMEARHQLVQLAEQRGDAEAAARWRRAIIKAHADAGPAGTERSRYLAANASLVLADALAAQCREIRLAEPLKVTLRKKKALLEKALASYGEAAEYGVAGVTTASSYAIGNLYADFARALLESERPKSLKGEALEEYELLLEEEALPFEEKAIQVHELNIRRTAQGVYDDWVRRSYSELARLIPARYAKSERSEGFVDTIQ